MNSYIITTHAVASVICWTIVGLGAIAAIFSPTIRDTVCERIALCAIGLGSIATASRVIRQGWISEGGLFLSAALAFYVCVIAWKHWRNREVPIPRDKVPKTSESSM